MSSADLTFLELYTQLTRPALAMVIVGNFLVKLHAWAAADEVSSSDVNRILYILPLHNRGLCLVEP